MAQWLSTQYISPGVAGSSPSDSSEKVFLVLGARTCRLPSSFCKFLQHLHGSTSSRSREPSSQSRASSMILITSKLCDDNILYHLGTYPHGHLTGPDAPGHLTHMGTLQDQMHLGTYPLGHLTGPDGFLQSSSEFSLVRYVLLQFLRSTGGM